MYEIRIAPACISARLSAWLIDAAITLAMMGGLMYRIAGTADIEQFILQTNYAQLAIVTLAPMALHVLFMGVNQATIGMYAMDLQLLQSDGELIEWSHAFRRPIGVIVVIATAFMAGLIPFMNEHRRTVGDYISGTRVVESMALGRRVSYDAWRIFKTILRPVAPISLAIAIAFLLLKKGGESNKTVLLDAVVIAATGTVLLATAIAAIKVKISRVRVSPKGVQRSGWLGWSSRLVEWDDMDYAQIRPRKLFPCFEIHKNNHGTFSIPLEHNSAQYTAGALLTNGVRIEQ